MAEERFLVTGAMGCIGAWAVKQLLGEGAAVVTYDLATDAHRLRLLMEDDMLARVTFLKGDITDLAAFEGAVREHRITHIIHLAAWQVPLVKANPVVGAAVNVVGTTVVLEAARRCRQQLAGLVYASSAGVYGPDEANPSRPLTADTPLNPPTLYGVFKQANEGTARIYYQDYGVPSLCLRPCGIVYGPGRDQGMSSPPSKALLAAAAGRPFEVAFEASTVFEYARDVAAAFIQGARAGVQGAPACNLGGVATTVSALVAMAEEAAPEARGLLTIADQQLVGPIEVDEAPLAALIGPLHWAAPREGVRETIAIFKRAVAEGRLDVQRILADPSGGPLGPALGES
jgi:nucleoside-diphosphate-sugar epimerase